MDSRATVEAALQPIFERQQLRGEIVDPGDSYWYHRPTRNFPPRAVQHPADHDGGDRLSLSVTQGGLGAAAHKALMRDWCARLPSLAGVRTLWLHTRVSQELFEAACAMPGLEGLYVKWSGIVSLAPMAGMDRLAYFHLGSAPSATALETLATLPRLVDLEIFNVRAAGDLRFVHGLGGLRALAVGGDANSIKALHTPSLAPLATLRHLERLSLALLQVADGSLAPLAELPKLKYLGVSNRFAMEEFARLAGRRPDIDCARFAATSGPVASVRCRKCRQPTLHLLTGQGRPWLCETCDAARLARHVAAFRAIVQAAAR